MIIYYYIFRGVKLRVIVILPKHLQFQLIHYHSAGRQRKPAAKCARSPFHLPLCTQSHRRVTALVPPQNLFCVHFVQFVRERSFTGWSLGVLLIKITLGFNCHHAHFMGCNRGQARARHDCCANRSAGLVVQAAMLHIAL